MNSLQYNYTTNTNFYQLTLPLNIGYLIPDIDAVFVLKDICNSLDFSKLMSSYSTIGREPKVSPKNLFTLLVYAYMNGVFSSRQIESLCKRDIYYMFICDEQVIDCTTIARFRTKRLTSEIMEDFCSQLIKKLVSLNEVKLNNLFIDGTKIEANANCFTFVWKGSIAKNKEKLTNKITFLIQTFNELFNKSLIINNATFLKCLNYIIHFTERYIKYNKISTITGKGHKKEIVVKLNE